MKEQAQAEALKQLWRLDVGNEGKESLMTADVWLRECVCTFIKAETPRWGKLMSSVGHSGIKVPEGHLSGVVCKMSRNLVQKHSREGWAAHGDLGIFSTEVANNVGLRDVVRALGERWRRRGEACGQIPKAE